MQTNALKLTLVLSVIFMLSACGFQLRGDYQVALNLQKISLEAPTRSQAAEFLTENLQRRNIEIVTPGDDVWHIQLQDDKLDQRIMSLLQSGQVAEYELIYTLPVIVYSPSGEVNEHTIQITRDYQEDPDYALAKVREMELLITEMRQNAVQRLLLLLNRITHR